MELNPVIAAVCALSCACLGGVAVIAFLVARMVGGQFFDIIGSLLGRGSNTQDDSTDRQRGGIRRAPASEAIRQQARAVDFDAALRQQGGVIPPQQQTFGAQSAAPQYGQNPAPYGAQSAPPAGNYPAFPSQPASNYPPQTPPPNYGGLVQRPPQPPQAPQPPQQGGYTGMVQRPPQAPAQGTPTLGSRRPTLSAPRQLGNTPPAGHEDSRFGDLDNFNTDVPGLRNRTRRRGDDGEVYDDEGDDIAGGLGNFFGL